MVAVRSFEADRFLDQPPPQIFLYLLFGTDAGLVTERAQKILSRAVADRNDPFALVRIGGDELAGDPARLADEANTIPLFGGTRAISIVAQGRAFMAAVEPVLEAPPGDCTIVIEAGNLKKDAPLRSLCERAKTAAAVQCYPDSAKDIAKLIDAEVAAAGLSISPDAKAFLISQLGEDRLSTRSEIEKLVLHAHGAREIILDHVAAVACDASSLIASDVVNAAFLGDHPALDASLRHALAAGSDCQGVLAAALRHALDLHRARCGMEDGPLPRHGSAFSGFKQKDAFERHLRSWTRSGLGQAVETISAAIAAARREPKLGPSLAARALWTVARSARSKAPDG